MVDCIIFSTGRAASTSIYNYLDEACALGLPSNKEPHFWLDGALDYRGIPDVLHDIYLQERDAYERLYEGARFRIDASVGYYHYAEKVISKLRAAGFCPKVLILVREPLSWAKSLHVVNLHQGIETVPQLEDCLAEDRDDRGLWWQLRYRDVRYREVFETISAALPDVMLVDYADFRRDVAGSVRAICRFLGLEIVRAPSGRVYNSSRALANQMRFAGMRGLASLLPGAIRQPLAQFLKRMPVRGTPPVPDQALAEALGESIASYDRLKQVTRRYEPRVAR